MSKQQVPVAKRALGTFLGAVLAAASFASAFTFAAPTPTAAAAGSYETRGGFVAQVGQALCLVADSSAVQKFSDVPPSDPNFGYIMTASALGWISGYPNGTFQPDGSLTREQMVKVEVIALGLGSQAAALSSQQPVYSDADSIGRWAWGYVDEATDIGIVQGLTDGSFAPNQIFTTGEATDALAELTAYLAAHDQPVVTAVAPSSGAAGDTVNVNGSGFCGASGVAFGSTPATSFTVDSMNTLTAVAPSGSGTVDLTVTTQAGTSAKGSSDLFSYQAPSGGVAPPQVRITDTVASVASLPDLLVTAGTPIGSMGLPLTVQVTLSNGTTSTMGVTWDSGSPAYNGDTAGSYAFTGTLTLPGGVTNPNDLTAAANVVVTAGPPDSGHSSLNPATQNATAGPGNITLTAQVADQYGNAISGLGTSDFAFGSDDAKVGAMTPVSVTETATKGTYTIVLTDTDENGGAPQTLSGSVQGVALNPVEAMVAAAAPATISIVSPQNATNVAAGASEPVTFAVRDAYQNPVPGALIDFETTGSLNVADLAPSTLGTDANGEVTTTYSDTQANDTGTVAGTVYGTVYGPTAQSGTLTIVAQAPDASQSSVSPPTQTVTASSGDVSLTVVVGDVYGNAISGLGATDFEVTSGMAGSLTPSVTETSTPGTYTLILTDTDANGGAAQTLSVAVDAVPIGDVQVTVTPAAAADISIVSPTTPTDVTVGHGQDVTFLVTDAYMNPVSGTQVDFGTNGSLKARDLGAANAVTGSGGEATVTYTDTTATDAGQVIGTLDGTSLSVASPTLTIAADRAADGAKSSLSADPSTVQAAPGDVSLTAQVADSYGNAISGLVPTDFAVSSSDAAVNPLTPESVTEASTPGTYTIVLTDTDTDSGHAQTLTVLVDGVPLPTTLVTVTPAAASSIVVVSPTGATTISAGTGKNVTFEVTDAYQNPVPGETVDFSVNGSLDSHGLSAVSDKTGSNGRVKVTYTDAQSGDSGQVIATDGSLTAESGTLTVGANGLDAGHSSVTPASQSDQAGTGNVTLKVVAEDQYGNPAGGLQAKDFAVSSDDTAVGTLTIVSVTETTPGTYAVVATDTDTNGGNPQTLSTTVSGVRLNTVQVTVTAAAAANIAIVSPSGATNVVAGTPEDVTFLITDQYNNDVPNTLVEFTSSGTLSPANLSSSAKTGPDGEVTAVYTDTVAGHSGAVMGTLWGTTTSALSGTLTIVAGPPVKSESTVKPADQTVPAGPGDIPLTIQLADQYGNPILGLGTSDFAISSSDANVGTVTPDSVTSTGRPGTYTVVLTDEDAFGGLAQTLSTKVDGVALTDVHATVDPAAASLITVTAPTVPTKLTAGQSETISFHVTDAYMNPVQGATVDFATTGSLKGTLGAPSALTNSTGNASVTYTDTKASDRGKVQGTIDSTTDIALSPTLTIVAETTPSAGKSLVTPRSQVDQAGDENVTLTVQVADQYGNAIPGLTQPDFSVDDPSAALAQVTESTTAPGTYTLKITDTNTNSGSPQTVTVSVDGVALNPVQVTITAGNAAAISVASPVHPHEIVAGGSQQVTFLVTDAYGHPVSGQQVDFSASATLSHGQLSVPSASTGPNGYVSVDFQNDTTAGDEGQVTGTIDGQSTSATSATLTIIAGAVAQGTVTLTSTTPVKAGPGDITLTVTAADDYHNPISGLTAADFAFSSNDAKLGTMTPVSVSETATKGTYTIVLTDTDANGGAAQAISTTVDSIPLNSVSVTVTPGEPASVVELAPKPNNPITGAVDVATNSSTTVTFEVMDAYGNVVPGVLVDFGIANPDSEGRDTLPATDLGSTGGITGGAGSVSVTLAIPRPGLLSLGQAGYAGQVTCTVHNTGIQGASPYFHVL